MQIYVENDQILSKHQFQKLLQFLAVLKKHVTKLELQKHAKIQFQINTII